MQVKTFRADSLQDALLMVKKDLGDDAIILSTGTAQERRRYGFTGKKLIEVTAAVENEEEEDVERTERRKKVHVVVGDERSPNFAYPGARGARRGGALGFLRRILGERGTNAAVSEAPVRAAVANEASAPERVPIEVLNGLISPLRDELEEIKERMEEHAKKQMAQLTVTQRPFEGNLEVEAVRSELREVRGMLDNLMTTIKVQEFDSLGHDWRRICQSAQQSGLSKDIPIKILSSMKEKGELAEMNGDLKADQIKAAFINRIPQTKPIELALQGPKVVVLVGPTGVGKTTTLAKIASLWALKERRKVAVFSADSFRIGAFAQLSTYAKILGIACEEIRPTDDLDTVINSYRHHDLILIDTFGVSPNDKEKIDALKKLIDGSKYPVEVHLVLNANTRTEDLESIWEALGHLGISRVVFTKLDETNRFGGIYQVLYRSQLPLSYVGLGQRVPEDLGEMTSRQVVEFFIQ